MRDIHGEKLRKHRMVIVGILSAAWLFLTGLTAHLSPSTNLATHAKPEAHRLRTGHFIYRTIDHGKNVGKGQITIRRFAESGNYDFSGAFDFLAEFKDYPSQRWKSIATSELEPISAMLSFDQAAGDAPIFALKYTSGRVTGFVVSRQNSDTKTKRSIDAALPANTFDQRLDWAVILASPLGTGQQFEFKVYDPGTGISRVSAQVGSLERVQVPAGSFDAYRIIYRIDKTGRTEQYQVHASRDLPRALVREEFPNGSVDELMEMTEGADCP